MTCSPNPHRVAILYNPVTGGMMAQELHPETGDRLLERIQAAVRPSLGAEWHIVPIPDDVPARNRVRYAENLVKGSHV